MKLGPALRHAWVGYQLRLDAEMAATGFARAFPDGRVLRICVRSPQATISDIGRELGITRQGASKIVAALLGRGYVTLTPSPADRREKIVGLTPHAVDYLAAQRQAVERIEAELEAQLGPEVLDSVYRLADALGGPDQPRMSDYLREATGADEPGPGFDSGGSTGSPAARQA